MDFALSDEQRLFTDELRRFLEERAPVARIREIAETPAGHDPDLWRELAELGVTGLLVPERFGGSEQSLLDAALVSELLGWAALPSPYLSTCVLAPVALTTSGTAEQQKEWLPRIASGELSIGAAVSEVISRREDAGVSLEDGRLEGRALFALDSAAADAFLVASPKRLHLVPRSSPGLRIEPLRTIDATRRLAELLFEGVEPAETLGGQRGGPAALTRSLDAARVCLAADTLGASQQMLDRAVAYAKDRKQFGRVIASFQAVKHLCAEMVAEIEPSRSLVWYAAHAFDHVPADARLVATLAKAHLAEVGTTIASIATQVHGGVGFTDEQDLHIWFKRIGLNRQLLGGPEQLRARAAELQRWGVTTADAPQDVESPLL